MLSKYIRSWRAYKLHIGLNLPPKDNLRKEDKSSAPKVSFIWRFHCISSKSDGILCFADQLEKVGCFKYLGLMLSSDYHGPNTLSQFCSKVKRLFGLIFTTMLPSQALLEMYLTLVRPHTEYASSVWGPHLQKDKQLWRSYRYWQWECVRNNGIWGTRSYRSLSVAILKKS